MPHAAQGNGEPGISATRDTSTDNGTSTTCVMNSTTTVAPATTRLMLDRWKTATARGDLPVSEVLQQPNAK
ncbi:hypothetical protein MGN70_014027 [Eutypa lata]|nr:hypothetical protein MGN70_014027 [Eutypa lata]